MGKGGVSMERLTQEAQIGPFASLRDKAAQGEEGQDG